MRMKAILDSINQVSNLHRRKESGNVLKLVSTEKVTDFRMDVSSIEEVSRCFVDYSKIQSEKISLLDPTVQYDASVEAVKVVSLIANKRLINKLIYTPTDNITFLEAISKNHDENFHSDFLASLLDTEIMGSFSYEFLKQIVSYLSGVAPDVNNDKPIKVWREKRLDKIDETLKGTEKGARRIDLYIRHNDFILIIENKISTSESLCQTTDYYSTTKKVHSNRKVCGLLLSPDGEKPLEKSFSSMTYRELIDCLYNSSHQLKSEISNNYFRLYFNSLIKQFIETDTRYHNKIETYWKELHERKS